MMRVSSLVGVVLFQMRDCLVFMLVVLVLALSIQSSEADKKVRAVCGGSYLQVQD